MYLPELTNTPALIGIICYIWLMIIATKEKKMIFILPLNIATEFRIIYRIIIETIKGLNRTSLMNFVIIGTMAAILSIFGCLFRTSLGISSFVQELGTNLQISVYLKPGANPERISKEINNLGHIKNIEYYFKR